MLCLLLLCGCSGAAGGGVTPGANETGDDSEDADPDEERARLLAQFKDKQRECGAFGAHIEKSEAGTAIVNLNDAKKLRQLAGRRQQIGANTGKLELSIPELVQLRDRYRDTSDSMAMALRQAAEGKSVSAQKQALGRYRELDGDVSTMVDDLNAFCAKPIEQ